MKWLNDFTMCGIEFVKKCMLFQNSIPNASAVLFKKEIYKQQGGVNTDFKINGDWDLYTRMLRHTDISYISESLNYFRQHNKKGSSVNIINGNNISEYYWLFNKWVSLISLSSHTKSRLAVHIFSIWKNQYNNNITQLLRSNFIKIFISAFRADPKVMIRILRMAL
jgi:hypothetical protein